MSAFSHERLDVYRAAIEFVVFAKQITDGLRGDDREDRNQLVRASGSIVRNIAEGNGKWSKAERARFLKIASGSTSECAATLDIMVARGVRSEKDTEPGKRLLIRISSMLTRWIHHCQEAAPPARFSPPNSYESKYEFESDDERIPPVPEEYR